MLTYLCDVIVFKYLLYLACLNLDLSRKQSSFDSVSITQPQGKLFPLKLYCYT